MSDRDDNRGTGPEEPETLEIDPGAEGGELEVERILRKSGVPSFFPPPAGEQDLEATLEALRPEPEEVVADAEAEQAPSDEAEHPSDVPEPLIPPRSMPPDPDPGATAARQRIPRRARRQARPTLAGFNAAGDRARAELLVGLAQGCEGAARAELLVSAGELLERLGQTGDALTRYREARVAAPDHPIALRELRKHALQQHDWDGARELFEAEARLPLSGGEQALLALGHAELERAAGDAEAARAAARRATEMAPASTLARVVLASLEGEQAKRAEALQDAANLIPDGATASALQLGALRALRAAGEHARAAAAGDAIAEPTAAIALETASSALASSQLQVAQRALATLARGAGRACEPYGRLRARLLARTATREQACVALAGHTSAPSLRLRTSLLQAEGEAVQRRDALDGWRKASTGLERALASMELAVACSETRDVARSEKLLLEARELTPWLLLLELADARAQQVGGMRPSLAPRAGESDEEAAQHALVDAAHLASSPDAGADELQLLERAREPSARVLSTDAALEQALPQRVLGELERALHNAGDPERAGAQLAWARAAGEPPAAASEDALGALVAAATDREHAGEHWLSLARSQGESFAAFAATLAGDLMDREGGAREAYELALAAHPGYGPACWALEELLDPVLDDNALHRAHRGLARASTDPVERAGRLVRAAGLIAERSPEDAAALLREAREANPRDPTLDGGLRDGRSAEGDDDAGGSPLARVARLLAAAGHEDEGQPARAAAIYREVLERSADDPHAELGLERTLEHSGLRVLLGARREQLAHALDDESARAEVLEQLAWEHMAAGDQARADAGFHALREAAPYSVPALRALERQAMAQDDQALLADVASTLADVTADPRERAGQARLAARSGAECSGQSGELGLWHALRAEREARRRADPGAALVAARSLSDHFSSPIERTSWLLRCATLADQSHPESALEILRQAARGAPSHPLVHEQLARHAQAAGDRAEAARAYEAAARVAPSKERGAHFDYRAGSLWQRLGEPERARAALERAAAADLSHLDVFERLRQLLEAAQEHRAVEALLARRAAIERDPARLAELETARAATLTRLGERDGAKEALSAALTAQPHGATTLRGLADLQLADGQYAEAAETLIALARTEHPRTLRGAFLDLGRIYQDHLPDLRRAEIAYTRALAIEPDDVQAIERLIEVYAERGSRERALRAARRLIELAPSEASVDRATARLAGLLARFGESDQASRLLDARREERPTSPDLILAIADLHEDLLDHASLVVHLDRSAHALRSAIEREPGEPAHWQTLVTVLGRRDRPSAAATAATLASGLGIGSPELAVRAAERPPLGEDALREGSLRRLWPEGLPEPARNLLRWLEAHGDGLLPHAARGRPLELDDDLRAVTQRTSELLGCAPPTLYAIAGRACMPRAQQPLTVTVGQELIDDCDNAELTFLVTRAAATALLGLGAAAHDGAALAALLKAVQTPTQETSDGEALDTESRRARERLTRLDSRGVRQLRELVFDAVTRNQVDPAGLAALALRVGGWVALAAGCELPAALRGLAALETAGNDGNDARREAIQAAGASDEARSLLRFALSDAHLDLRART